MILKDSCAHNSVLANLKAFIHPFIYPFIHSFTAKVLREQIVSFLVKAHGRISPARAMLRLTALGDHAYKMLVNASNLAPNTFSVIFDQT